MEKIKLSIIVPVYNEELFIAETLKKITDFLRRKNYGWEVIVVDDGSSDKTGDVIKGLNFEGVKFDRLPQNQGKGAAIRRGVEIAVGNYIIFTDADLSVPIEFTDKLMDKLQIGSRVVIGSRRTAGAKIIKHQNLLRESMGRVFTFLSKVVTGAMVSDFTCGFKGFEGRVAKKIFSKSLINRWVFDSEILFLAKKFKYEIVEVPVEWVNREDSRIKSLGGAGYKSFLELMQIRLNDLVGKYD
jgi:dolichyl-phosphate beta-glucosyltransferase